jgi:hypothetical protein
MRRGEVTRTRTRVLHVRANAPVIVTEVLLPAAGLTPFTL